MKLYGVDHECIIGGDLAVRFLNEYAARHEALCSVRKKLANECKDDGEHRAHNMKARHHERESKLALDHVTFFGASNSPHMTKSQTKQKNSVF